jgi:hypothetical protein
VALALGAVLAAGCTFAPPGECAATADCEAGLTCQGGVCVGCSGDASCASWQVCSATRRCVSAPGACGGDAECAAWERCGAGHACEVRPGQCGAATDCGSWETCTAHRCEPLPGNCSGQEDCPWYQGCRPEHVCGRPLFDPEAVAMWGTLDAAACTRRAVAPVLAPEQARVGFDCSGPGGPAAIGPQGDLLYTTVAGPLRGVSRFEPDTAGWSGTWSWPVAPLAPDVVVVAQDACAGTGLDHWLLQAGSGDVLYACPVAGGFDYFDAAGASRFSGPRVLAWTAGGARLTRTATGFQVVGAGGAALPVAGLGPSVEVLAVRAHGEGFWVVDGAGFGAPRRYAVSAAGQAVFDGAFAALPPGVAVDPLAAGSARLDGAGVLWERGTDGAEAVVARRPLAPGEATVAYREAAAPAGANDLSVQAFLPYVLLQAGPLVTGP